MEYLYIILGVTLAGLFFQFLGKLIFPYFTKLVTSTPYEKVLKRLQDDLLQAELSKDFYKKQEINLHLLWLKTLKEVKSKDFLGRQRKDSERLILSKIGEEELKLPLKWNLDNYDHLVFIGNIIAAFEQVLVENEYKAEYVTEHVGGYKPDFILPLPKSAIKEAICYTLNWIQRADSASGREDRQDLEFSLQIHLSTLNNFFVDTKGVDLPKDDVKENDRLGKLYLQHQPGLKGVEQQLVTFLNEHELEHKGRLYIDKGEYSKAVEYFDRCLFKNPDNVHALIGMGICLYQLKEYDKSIEHLERALVLRPDDEITLHNLAQASFSIGDTKRSMSCYDRIIKLNPGSGFAYYQLAVIHATLGNKQLAQALMVRAAKRDHREARLWLIDKGILESKPTL